MYVFYASWVYFQVILEMISQFCVYLIGLILIMGVTRLAKKDKAVFTKVLLRIRRYIYKIKFINK